VFLRWFHGVLRVCEAPRGVTLSSTASPNGVTPPSRYDAILFDFDGVLADTEPVHFACWKEVLEPLGIHLNWPFYQERCIGVSDRLMVERLAAERIPPLPLDQAIPAYHSKLGIFRAKIEANPPFLAETVSMVRRVCSVYRLAVVSSSGRPEVEEPIERAGFRDCFHAFVCGKEALNLKPSPDPYLRAAELLGATRPLVVEDSDAGVESARAAGFDVLRVSSAASVAREVRAWLERGSAGSV
jgi:beta-phosphoglucomutase